MTVVSLMGDDLAQAPRVFYLDASALIKRYLTERGSTNKPLLDSGLPSLTFVAADDDLLAAAEAEGLPTENPNHYD